ncbi:MAG: CotH kinase family protein, partial [Myxococcota bacterium]
MAEADLDELREQLADPAEVVSAHRKCTGAVNGRCDIVAAVRLKRALDDPESVPGFGQMCAAGKQPADPTEYYFNPTRLLDITLILEPESWEVLRREGFGGTACANAIFFLEIQCRFAGLFALFATGQVPLPSPYNWYFADVEIDDQIVENIGARKKGFIGSTFSARPSLKFDFPEFVKGQRLNGLRRMTLNNNNQDNTRVRTCTNYRFLRDIGLPAPRCTLAHVQVNAEDMGIYSSIDPINSGLLARHFGDGNGRLYEGQAADFIPSQAGNFQPKSQAAADDTSEIEALTAAIQIADPEERLAAIEGIVNVDSFLNLWAGEGIAGLWDGYVASANNFLFYIHPGTGLIEFIPWGADHGLGDQDFTHCTTGNELRTITPRSALSLALYGSETFRERLVERVEYVVENVWNPERYIAEANRLNEMMGRAPSAMGGIKTWIAGRRARTRAEIADGAPDISDLPD